jgi:hypothetical protein
MLPRRPLPKRHHERGTSCVRSCWRSCLPVFLTAVPSSPGAQESREIPEEDESTTRITAELEARNPEAADLFRQANQARADEKYFLAGDLYERVHQLVPDFHHAMRRHAWIMIRNGERIRAIALSRRANELSPETSNEQVLLAALMAGESPHLDGDERMEALSLAVKLVKDDTVEPGFLPIIARVAELHEDLSLLERVAERLVWERPRRRRKRLLPHFIQEAMRSASEPVRTRPLSAHGRP